MRNDGTNLRFGAQAETQVQSRSLVQVSFAECENSGDGWVEQGSLQLSEIRRFLEEKKGYLYFTLPSRLLQHGHRGDGDWQ